MSTASRPTFDRAQLLSFARAVMDPAAGCMEMRIFSATWGKGNFIEHATQYSKTLAGWFDDPLALASVASQLRGVSGFVTLNPVNRDLLARCYNKVGKAKHTTTDNDIAVVRWVYVDIDPVRAADISSTDEELAAAVDRRDLILDNHPGIRASSIWGRSGNGAFIMVRTADRPNGPEARDLVARFLGALARDYSDDVVKVDPTTKNPARVACLPGTMKCKGSDMPGRPWRMAEIDGGAP